MKKVVLLLTLFVFALNINSQNNYMVNGETLQLQKEVHGSLILLWNIIDNEYRYFIKKGESIVELTNTRGENKKYKEEYKVTLGQLTQGSDISTDNVDLTLPSLREFVYTYNASVDPNYSEIPKKSEVKANLLFFGGITNTPFVENHDNTILPVLGAEIEVYEPSNLPRHSLYFQIKHAFKSDDFEYSNTQLGLGYRFRFIKQEAFNIYANVMMATYSFVETQIEIQDEVINVSDNVFDVPIIFGVGADFKVGQNGFITVAYDELFAFGLDNEGSFSTHITVGYKFTL